MVRSDKCDFKWCDIFKVAKLKSGRGIAIDMRIMEFWESYIEDGNFVDVMSPSDHAMLLESAICWGAKRGM